MMYSAADTLWVLLGTVLVFFMQAGFSMVESGFTRAKNAGNIIMKNMMDFSIGSLTYWFIGFGLMFGETKGGFIGSVDFFVKGSYTDNIPTYVFVMFQTVFCATGATIVSGAMAERTKFSSYCIYSVILSMCVYPVSGHWIWGDGWLANMGFHDFAGSTAVHMMGGVAAIIGAKILGPRIGKYDKDGNSKAILGHNLTLGALGVFILWFAWFGFNGASTIGASDDETLELIGHIFMTTNIAASAGAAITMMLTWVKYKKPDVSMTLNGALGGLVAITAGCDVISPMGAFGVGLIAAFVIVYGIEFVDTKLKIDDPVGASGVHGMCGAMGTILVGFLSVEEGLLYGFGSSLLMVQLTGVVAVAGWVFITMTPVFLCIKNTVGLRVTEQEEIKGLDIEEHGLQTSYAGFMTTIPSDTPMPAPMPVMTSGEESISVEGDGSGSGISNVVLIIKKEKFDAFKTAMSEIGITGMTVTQVLGCGMQKGATEYYRGVAMEMNLLPKLKIEIVVGPIPVEIVVKKAQECLSTGNIGDGKIFTYSVDSITRIRTGEHGFAALENEK